MTAPQDFDDLRIELANKHASLSKRLRQIAEYALENPNDMALETVSTIAERADVQPSSLIRFAKAFGYSGFSEMQRVFRARLLENKPDYKERIRSLAEEGGGDAGENGIIGDFVQGGIAALNHLNETLPRDLLDKAIQLLVDTDTIYLAGQRRSFPVAAYLSYALSKLGKRCILLDGTGGMFFEQAASMRRGDMLMAISFKSYSPEIVQLVQDTAERDIPVLSITDSPLSPLVPNATVCLEVEEVEVHSFRALNATMTLAIALVVGLGRQLEKKHILN